jgi:hypothetical protein
MATLQLSASFNNEFLNIVLFSLALPPAERSKRTKNQKFDCLAPHSISIINKMPSIPVRTQETKGCCLHVEAF